MLNKMFTCMIGMTLMAGATVLSDADKAFDDLDCEFEDCTPKTPQVKVVEKKVVVEKVIVKEVPVEVEKVVVKEVPVVVEKKVIVREVPREVNHQPKVIRSIKKNHQLWQGEYICRPGKINMEIEMNLNNNTATMHFWNKKGVNGYGKQYDGIIYGTVTINGRDVAFRPNTTNVDSWNVRPADSSYWRSVRWNASHIDPLHMDGRVEGYGCSSISLTRVN